MDKKLKEFLEAKNLVNSPLFDIFSSLEGKDALVVSNLIEHINPTLNSLREIIRLGREISIRDEISLFSLFNENKEIIEIIQSKMSRKQKTTSLQKKLQAIRYPQVTKIKEELDRLTLKIKKKYKVDLKLPKDLEGFLVLLDLKVKSPKDFSKLSNLMLNLSKDEDVLRIYEILAGEVEV